MKDLILNKLSEIEEIYKVEILYAVEAGSRSWGFSSEDSDFDVRFVYIHPPEWYLSIDPQGIGSKRDVIEAPINDRLDLNGWEVTKALRLFRKSNPPLLEWLTSDRIYFQKSPFINKIKALEQQVFNPSACLHHYLNIAKNNYRKLHSSEIKIKIYLYLVRSVLACKWIEQYNEFPPNNLQVLVNLLVPEGILKNEIHELIKRKMSGEEMAVRLENKVLNEYLESEIQHITNFVSTHQLKQNDPTEKLNLVFRDTLNEVFKETI